MTTKLAAQGPIQLRRDEASDQELVTSSPTSESGEDTNSEQDSDGSASENESLDSDAESQDEGAAIEDAKAVGESEGEDSEPEEPLQEISFGTLAEAQEKYAPKPRKRKLPGDFDAREKQDDRYRSNKPQNRRDDGKQVSKQHRQSKHAPTIISSRQQVSRKRDVFDPSPAVKSRDPRFDPTIMSSNYSSKSVEKSNKNYAFLTSYQAAEILDLKAQIKKTKDPETVAGLKRKVMSVESRIRRAEAQQRESKILKEHNQKEREAIRSGQKANPYYLKPGEIKKKAEEERVGSMGKRARDKAEKRKKKREKSKDAKNMPRFRREG